MSTETKNKRVIESFGWNAGKVGFRVWNRFTQIKANGATLYSYGEHYPLAAFVNDQNGHLVAMVNQSHWSRTTEGHINLANHMLAGFAPVVHVPNLRELMHHGRDVTRYGLNLHPEAVAAMASQLEKRFNDTIENIRDKTVPYRVFWQFYNVQKYAEQADTLQRSFGIEPGPRQQVARAIYQFLQETRFFTTTYYHANGVTLPPEAFANMSPDLKNEAATIAAKIVHCRGRAELRGAVYAGYEQEAFGGGDSWRNRPVTRGFNGSKLEAERMLDTANALSDCYALGLKFPSFAEVERQFLAKRSAGIINRTLSRVD